MSAFLESGIHDIPSSQYHADMLTAEPSLSNSILHTLVTQTPKHAWMQHPRLNPFYAPKEDAKFDIGKAVHALLLEGVDICHVVDADDWKTKAAKVARDEARAEGKTPLLKHQFVQCKGMVEASLAYVESTALAGLFNRGKGEQTLLWKTPEGVSCKALMDWPTNDRELVVDLKTTAAESPEAWIKGHIVQHGYDTQAEFTKQGLSSNGHHGARFIFLVQQTEAPFMCFMVEPDETMSTIAASKIRRGQSLWKECLSRNEWPGYSREVYQATPPAWAINEEEALL